MARFNAAQLAQLKTELTAGHPDTGAYSADDHIAADELNATNRPGLAPVNEIAGYCFRNDVRGGNVYGRIAMVANAQPGVTIPMGVGGSGDPQEMKTQHVAAAQAFIAFITAQIDGDVTAIDTILADLALGPGAHAIEAETRTALVALSENRQSRASEIGLPRPRGEDVRLARL